MDEQLFPLPDQPPASDNPSDTSDNPSDNRVSLRLDQEAADNLAALVAAAGNQTNAIRYALRVAAQAARGAWGLGFTPPGQLPEVTSFRVTIPGRPAGEIHLPKPPIPPVAPPYQQLYAGPFQQPYPGPYQQPTYPPLNPYQPQFPGGH